MVVDLAQSLLPHPKLTPPPSPRSNTALMMCGLAKPVFRLPYVPLSRAQREDGAKLLEAVREHLPGVEAIRVMEDDEFKIMAKF